MRNICDNFCFVYRKIIPQIGRNFWISWVNKSFCITLLLRSAPDTQHSIIQPMFQAVISTSYFNQMNFLHIFQWLYIKKKQDNYESTSRNFLISYFQFTWVKFVYKYTSHVTLLHRIQEVPGSKFDPETDYPHWNCSWFLSVPLRECWDSTLN
jgi:hypothetical protein